MAEEWRGSGGGRRCVLMVIITMMVTTMVSVLLMVTIAAFTLHRGKAAKPDRGTPDSSRCARSIHEVGMGPVSPVGLSAMQDFPAGRRARDEPGSQPMNEWVSEPFLRHAALDFGSIVGQLPCHVIDTMNEFVGVGAQFLGLFAPVTELDIA